jgi:hypothetical protein
MNKFSIDFAEYYIAGILQKEFSKKQNFSVNIPLSRQQKDYDLFLHNGIDRKSLTIQVKSSRTYITTGIPKNKSSFNYDAWFKRFIISKYCDFYFCYLSFPLFDPVNFKPKAAFDTKILVFDNNEMQVILDEIKTKRKGTPETFFGFGFNINSNKIFGTRGFVSATPREFTNNLFENKLTQLKKHIL